MANQTNDVQRNSAEYERTLGAADWGERTPRDYPYVDVAASAVKSDAPADPPSPLSAGALVSAHCQNYQHWACCGQAGKGNGKRNLDNCVCTCHTSEQSRLTSESVKE